MALESWITVEETPALAAEATAAIDARLSRFPARERDAFWASIRKAYNTPYNDPAPRKLAKPVDVKPIDTKPVDILVGARPLAEDTVPALPLAAIAPGAIPEIRAL